MELIQQIEKAWLVVNEQTVNALAYKDKIYITEEKLYLEFPYSSLAEELNCIVLGKNYQVIENKPTKLKLSVNVSGQLEDITKLPFVINTSKQIIAYRQQKNSSPLGLTIVSDPASLTDNQLVLFNDNTAAVSKNINDRSKITILAQGWLQRWIEDSKEPLGEIKVNLVSKTHLQVIQGRIIPEPDRAFLKTPTRNLAIANLREISNQRII